MSRTSVDELRKLIGRAQFVMLRYETEFTPCTGITAVTKQERRHFQRGIMMAPWCPSLKRQKPADDPLRKGTIRYTDWRFELQGRDCRVLITTDDFSPILFLEVGGRFLGAETPYDVPLPDLREDSLYFGLAVDHVLKSMGSSRQFVWGADWETVPALYLVRHRHHVSLTLHNTFDEGFEKELSAFGDIYKAFSEKSAYHSGTKTALETGMEVADVVTTVNRGFARGMRTEPLQLHVMARHVRHLLGRVVGINNAAFAPLSPSLAELRKRLLSDFAVGRDELFGIKAKALAELPRKIRVKAEGKAIVVSMGRRVSQKQHDLLVESIRQILEQDRNFPVLVVFATIHGDAGSAARLERMERLQEQFPSNVICNDGRLSYYTTLMAAADYNCMPSLYEPHGGAYEGTVIPIARAVDGLAEQICARNPKGYAAEMNAAWHGRDEAETGFLFREQYTTDLAHLTHDLKSLLEESPSPENGLFTAMRDSLRDILREAVLLRLDQPDAYANLVLAALEKQEGLSWHENLGGMIALIEEARIKRAIT